MKYRSLQSTSVEVVLDRREGQNVGNLHRTVTTEGYVKGGMRDLYRETTGKKAKKDVQQYRGFVQEII